eukprot:9502105-Pyramimonas_sp.AAC.1
MLGEWGGNTQGVATFPSQELRGGVQSADQEGGPCATPAGPPGEHVPAGAHLDPWAQSSLQHFKDQALKEFAAKAMATLSETLPCALVKATAPLLNQYEDKFNQHIRFLRQDLDRQSQRVSAVETKFAAMEERLAHL